MSVRHMHFDRQGDPISLDEWARLLQDPEYKRIAFDTLPDGRILSTVWLGLDHSMHLDVAPVIFETMLFEASPGGEALEQLRYTTETGAQAGHAAMLSALLRETDALH